MRWLILTLALVLAAPAQANTGLDLDKVQANLKTAAKALERARGGRARLAALGKAVTAYEQALSAYRAALRKLNLQEQRVVAQLAADRARHENVIGALQSLSQAPGSALMMYPGGPVAAMRGAGIMAELSPVLLREIEAMAARADLLRRLRADQEAARVEARGSLSTLQGLRSETRAALRSSRGTRLPDRAALKSQAEDAAAAANSLGELAGSLDVAVLAPQGQDVTFTDAKGTLPLPVVGQVIARYGDTDPWGRDGLGLTVEAPSFAQVQAPWDGTVRFSGPLIDYGNVVILEPEEGSLVVLAGLGTADRVVGETVLAGERLGDLGGPIPTSEEFLLEETTDRDEIGTRKLYMEIRRDGEAVDPADWFDLTERESSE